MVFDDICINYKFEHLPDQMGDGFPFFWPETSHLKVVFIQVWTLAHGFVRSAGYERSKIHVVVIFCST